MGNQECTIQRNTGNIGTKQTKQSHSTKN